MSAKKFLVDARQKKTLAAIGQKTLADIDRKTSLTVG